MIDRRVVLEGMFCGFIGLWQELAASQAFAADPAGTPPMPELPADFQKRAAELNYNLRNLWTTFLQVQGSYRSRDLSAFWHVSSAPLLLIDKGKRHEVNSYEELIKLANLVFDGKIRDAVMQCQFESLFLNSGGAMIGDGEVWIKEICQDPRCLRSHFAVATVDLFKDS
jgi:hypothetical protein